jgi:uncharacterized protein YhaN
MRLRRLDLVRYGKFTDFTIDFGEASPGRPDLHVVYGANEAGKSTTLAAWLDLLFGIPMQSGYGFLHPYSTMRIDALIESVDGAANGGARAFTRIKRPANSLLDDKGQPLAEAALRGALGNLNRETYCQMFSLDDETLEKGGEEILTSKGDLGQLLFAASAGLGGLSARLKQTQEEAEQIYKKGGSKNLIADRKRQLAELAERRKALDTMAGAYQELKRQAHEAVAAHEAADAERRAIAAAAVRNSRRLSAWPQLRALRQARADLAGLGPLPADSLTLVAAHEALLANHAEIASARRALADEIAGLDIDIGPTPLDEAVLALSTRIEALFVQRARFETAQEDLPKRELELRELEARLARVLAAIGQAGETTPEPLLIAAPEAARIRSLLDQRSGVDAALTAARTEMADAARILDEAEASLVDVGSGVPSPESRALLDGLAVSLAALRAANPAARLAIAAQAHARALSQLGGRLAALRPWRGAGDALAGLSLPSIEHVRACRRQIEVKLGEIAQLRVQSGGLQADIARYEAEIAAIAGAVGPATDTEAQSVRTARDATWAQHRRMLDASSADVFEAALRNDDRVTSALVAQGPDRGRLQELAKAKAIAVADARQAAERLEAASLAEAALRGELAAGLPDEIAGLPLSDLETWLLRHAAAIEAVTVRDDAALALREAQADADAHRVRLDKLLTGVGLAISAEEPADIVMARLEGLAQREAKIEALRVAASEARRMLKRRAEDLADAQQREARWSTEFGAACAHTWLGERAGEADIATVRAILPMLGELANLLDQKGSLGRRIDAMRTDQAEFTAHVAQMALALDMQRTQQEPVLGVVARIVARLRAAADDRARRDALRSRKEAALAKLDALETEARRHGAALAAHFMRLGAADLDEATRIVADLGRRDKLVEEARRAESDVLEILQTQDLAAAEALFEAGAPEEWQQDAEEAERRREAHERLCDELLLKRDAAQRSLDAVGADAKVAEIEEARRTLRLEMEDGAARYLRLRAGMLATEQALRLYRERHRSAMMLRASEAFKTVSRGAYRELATQPDAKGDRLIAVGADGSSKEAFEMSKGTRFQLYLALRVAGYEEFTQARPPVPFIADDIMETFDEMRAEEAFRVLGEMSLKGQVIYLTHHRHLCAIAREVVPTVALHEL